MPRKLSTRTALAAVVSLLALFFTAVGAAAVLSPGTVSFTSATYEVGEGAGSANVTLTRTGGTDGAVTAKVSLADVTTAPADYQFKPGSLDLSYAFVSPVEYFYYYQGMALQPDGKLVIGGSGAPLKRLNTDGTVDTGFTPPAFNAPIEAVALQPDGKIIVSGTFTGIPGAIRIARLHPDGTLDTSFNVGGGPNQDPIAIVVQPDGKIVIGGYFTSVNLSPHSHLARLNADGSVDETFNPNVSNCYVLALQPDGKILAGTPFIYRFNADGTQDNSFPGSYWAFALAPQPDGKILFGGTLRNNMGNEISRGVYRLLPDGALDPSFTTGTGTDGFIDALAVQPDGKIIAGGSGASYNGAQTGALMRLNTDGTLDSSFKLDQFVDPSIAQLVIQPDGKVIANGRFTAITPTGSRTNVARFNGDFFVSWAAGDAADKTVSIPIVNDLLDEPDETLTLTVTPLTDGVSTGAIPSATLTIHDDDVPPQITSQPPPQAIVGQFYTHTFTASGSPSPTFSVTSGGVPSGLILQPSGLLSGTPHFTGTTSITVTASNGVAPAATQSFDLVVASGGAIQFSATNYSVAENGGPVTITVNRVGGSAGAASVGYTTSGNTATSGSDFTTTSGTLDFADGETSKSFTVGIVNDDVNERDETLNLSLGRFTGTATNGTPTFATLTITNDDPLPTIAVEDVTVVEGDSVNTKQALFTITRTGLIDRSVTFTARTADGTAVAGEDYVATSSTFVSLPPNLSSITFAVPTIGDTIIEPDKSFFLNISSPANATITRATAVGTIKDNETTTGAPTVQFASQVFKVSEGAGVATVTVTRSGDTSTPTNVFYSTFNSFSGSGIASDRSDYNVAFGRLNFAAGETAKTFQVFITDDAFVEGDETLQIVLSGPTGGTTAGTPNVSLIRIIDNDTVAASANPIADSTFFVRQHYRDFLNRDPDADGLAFWVNEIEKCKEDAQCREVRRVNVSAAFFKSIEFKETGYLVYRLHKAAYNTGERLDYLTFLGQTQDIGRGVVVGAQGWEAKLEANKQAFIETFMQYPEFAVAYPQAMTPAQFVDALNVNTGDPLNPSSGGSLTQAERDQLVADLTAGTKTRAQVLRAVAENAEFQRRQSSKAFVLMQYFGYLRRAPNDSPNTNFDGYNFWLKKLNDNGGDFVKAEMVKAFIASDEYRHRFGQ